VPTISEVGLGDFDMEVWYGLLAPTQVPQPMISQLAAWITRAAKLPQTRARLAAQGMQAVDMCGTPFTAHLRKQYDDYGRVISEADIKAE
jgi:tripartite-type tricarboxylate transporter receptor subunit TctC